MKEPEGSGLSPQGASPRRGRQPGGIARAPCLLDATAQGGESVRHLKGRSPDWQSLHGTDGPWGETGETGWAPLAGGRAEVTAFPGEFSSTAGRMVAANRPGTPSHRLVLSPQEPRSSCGVESSTPPWAVPPSSPRLALNRTCTERGIGNGRSFCNAARKLR